MDARPLAPDQRPSVPHPWPRPAQAALGLVVALLVSLLGWQVYSGSRLAVRPTELERGAASTYQVDLNEASHAELLQLPGVGENLAKRIETYRRDYGPFQRPEDLARVQGVGPSTMDRLRPLVTANGEAGSKPSKKGSGRKEAPAAPLDLNLASAEELQRLPGIGPALSRRIVEERARRPFGSVDDLRRVAGIGAKKLEALRPYVRVGKPALGG